VSRPSVQRGVKVVQDGIQELADAVDREEVSVSAAAAAALGVSGKTAPRG
jgi:hypothetical protein